MPLENQPLMVTASFWIREDKIQCFAEAEDSILALLPVFGAELRARIRHSDYTENGETPFETHILSFPDQDSFSDFLVDKELEKYRDQCAQAILRKSVWKGHDTSANS